MSICLYKESPKKRPNGYAEFFPKHTTDVPKKESIDAVYYPFAIYENVIDFNKVNLQRLKKNYDSAEMLMEDFYKNLPNILGRRYRVYLKKNHFST